MEKLTAQLEAVQGVTPEVSLFTHFRKLAQSPEGRKIIAEYAYKVCELTGSMEAELAYLKAHDAAQGSDWKPAFEAGTDAGLALSRVLYDTGDFSQKERFASHEWFQEKDAISARIDVLRWKPLLMLDTTSVT